MSVGRLGEGERKKESAQGTMGRGKTCSHLSPFSIVPRALSIFPLLLFLLGYPEGAPAGERVSTIYGKQEDARRLPAYRRLLFPLCVHAGNPKAFTRDVLV